MSLSLVVLAAGVGRRYGGPKQIERVGPGGATLLDYAIFDGRRAGFERAILVVREGMEAEMREAVGDRIARRFRLDYAVQSGALPPGFTPAPGRAKPWGTGHAALAAAPFIDGPFAVVNADDFYGAASYRLLAEHLRRPGSGPVPEHALVGFPLRATLSPDGPVSRALCSVDVDGFLTRIREVLRLEPEGDDARLVDAAGRAERLAGSTLVSLNCWGFTREALDALTRGFRRFLADNATSTTAEYYLVTPVQALLDERLARVKVLAGGGPWGGLTHPGDRPRLMALLAGLTKQGSYPRELWD